MSLTPSRDQKIDAIDVETYRIPTDQPESDGTLRWDHTDLVVVRLTAGETSAIGWSYASKAAAELVGGVLRPAIVGASIMNIEGIWQEMNHRLRNAGRPGAGMMAVSAVDIALWDLKARCLDLPLVDLLGALRDTVEIYGSGGFTSYSENQLAEQLGGWASEGIMRVKMKVGREAAADLQRVRAARHAIGDGVELFVDANGGYARKQALDMARKFSEQSNVTWFEEPRSSDDLQGLHLMRDRGPTGMDIAAGEYGDTQGYFLGMLEAQAVDCLQADATRCGGYTGFLKVAALCEAFQMPLSAHCAPQLHAHIGCCVRVLRHVEYFHDHNRIARLLFDGAIQQDHGVLRPDRGRPGHGIQLKTADAARYRI